MKLARTYPLAYRCFHCTLSFTSPGIVTYHIREDHADELCTR